MLILVMRIDFSCTLIAYLKKLLFAAACKLKYEMSVTYIKEAEFP